MSRLLISTSQRLTTIEDLIAAAVEQNPNGIAIASPGRLPITYGRLYSHIQDTIKTLNSKGLGRNDRIAIVLPNGSDMATAFLGVAACATSAPLNPAYSASEFDFYLGDLNAKALIVQSGIDSPAKEVAVAHNIPIIELIPQQESGIFHLIGDTKLQRVDRAVTSSEDIALVLHTSGTTSRPKIVPLTQANLCTSAENIKKALDLRQSDRCLNVMPLFHIHGLIAAVLSSLASGGNVVCTSGFDAAKFFEWIELFEPTWYTAVPTMHQAVLGEVETNHKIIKECPLRLIRSSSSALPPQVMEGLERAFSVPVIEAYGMTEAAHQIACNPLPPQKRKVCSVGITAGPEIAIMDEVGNLLAIDEIGEIVIRGNNVTKGYESNPQANSNAFTNRWFRTGDQGYIDSDGYLFITGRLKELINRGGEKISPREIDEVLLDHPGVAQVVCFAVPHPTLGENVAAAIVLHQNVTVTEREIYEFAAKRLADFKVPTQVVFVEEIPKGSTGKVQRIGLADKLASKLKAAFVAPTTQIEKVLTEIWAEVLGVEEVGIQDNFFALGGDSLRATQIMLRLKASFQVDLPLGTLFQAPTIEQLAKFLHSPQECSYPWYSLVPIQPSGFRPPLFGIHILGYKHLANYLGLEQPIYGLRYGLAGSTTDHKPTLPSRIEDLAAHYIEEMRTFQPEGPYFLMGLCFGGEVAFEMAQQLIAQRQEVALLVLFDSHLSINIRERKLLPLQHQISNLLRVGSTEFIKRVKGQISIMLHRVKYHYQEEKYEYTPNSYGPIGDREFFETYTPKSYLGKVTFFKAMDGENEKLLSIRYSYDNIKCTLSKFIIGELDYCEIPSDHFNILEEPHVQLVAEKLKDCLNVIDNKHP
ncbi:AMP-binding protein [Nostoc linckia FACHB-104]|nr:AMP-binding protein [Nostoc linckia FACHB-104]